MNTQNDIPSTPKRLRTVEEIMDAELMKEGWTRQQLEEGKLLMDRYEELLLQGCTDAQINALWAGKTNQEILAMFDKEESMIAA